MSSKTATPVPRQIQSKPRGHAGLVSLYTGAVTAFGLGIVLVALTQLPSDLLGLVLFAVMAVVTELFSVELFTTSRNSSVSVTAMISTASILVFGPWAGALTQMASGFVTILTLTTQEPREPAQARISGIRRAAFNAGMFVAATAFAGWVYVFAGGTVGQVAKLSNIVPLLVSALADWLANIMILLGVIFLQTGQNPFEIWRQDFEWVVPIGLAGSMIGGGALALAYGMFGVFGLIVFFLPILSTSYSFRLYVSHTKSYVEKLEQLNRDLDEANLGLLETLGAVIDADDVYTYGHSTQVAVYAGAIAEKMNLPTDERDLVIKAALVHDIGKIGIMDSLLSKEGPLTNEEYTVIKRHTIIGDEIISRMKGLKNLASLVRHHHERWDGKGYPDGLEKEEIPRGARILALADAVDVLCSDRPYRSTKSFREVKEEIIRCSGSHFDPQVVRALLSVMEEKGRDFFKNSAVSVDRQIPVNKMGGLSNSKRYLKKSMVGESQD